MSAFLAKPRSRRTEMWTNSGTSTSSRWWRKVWSLCPHTWHPAQTVDSDSIAGLWLEKPGHAVLVSIAPLG